MPRLFQTFSSNKVCQLIRRLGRDSGHSLPNPFPFAKELTTLALKSVADDAET